MFTPLGQAEGELIAGGNESSFQLIVRERDEGSFAVVVSSSQPCINHPAGGTCAATSRSVALLVNDVVQFDSPPNAEEYVPFHGELTIAAVVRGFETEAEPIKYQCYLDHFALPGANEATLEIRDGNYGLEVTNESLGQGVVICEASNRFSKARRNPTRVRVGPFSLPWTWPILGAIVLVCCSAYALR